MATSTQQAWTSGTSSARLQHPFWMCLRFRALQLADRPATSPPFCINDAALGWSPTSACWGRPGALFMVMGSVPPPTVPPPPTHTHSGGGVALNKQTPCFRETLTTEWLHSTKDLPMASDMGPAGGSPDCQPPFNLGLYTLYCGTGKCAITLRGSVGYRGDPASPPQHAYGS